MNGNLVLCQLGMWWFFYFDKMLLKKEIGFFLWDEDKVELGKIVEIANRGASYEEKVAFVRLTAGIFIFFSPLFLLLLLICLLL